MWRRHRADTAHVQAVKLREFSISSRSSNSAKIDTAIHEIVSRYKQSRKSALFATNSTDQTQSRLYNIMTGNSGRDLPISLAKRWW